GFAGRALRAGDVLENSKHQLPLTSGAVQQQGLNASLERAGRIISPEFERYYSDDAPIRVIWGPHEEFFDRAARNAFSESVYTVTETSDRMGTRLRGEPISRAAGELLSCGVTRGAIQVPPDGQPIVLQADHQTAGGYPILSTVI